MYKHKRVGFTIVELLIVIVVIGILAAITIIAYNGIQQRAINTAKISTVNATVKLIAMYKAENGSLPITITDDRCLTTDNKCTNYSGTVEMANNNTALLTSLRTLGDLPSSAGDGARNTYYGITYSNNTTRTFNGTPKSLIIMFWLDGTNKPCTGVGGAVSVSDAGGGNFTPANFSSGNHGSSGRTRCYLMLTS